MKLRKLVAIVFALALVVAMMAGCGGKKEDDTVYELSYSMHDGATTVKYKMTEEWAKQIEEASNGRIKISIYPGGALAGQTEVVECVEAGTADFGMVYTSSYDAVFPLTNGITVPMLGIGSAPQATYVLWDLYDKYEQVKKEYEDFQLVHMYSNGTGYFQFTADNKVNTYDGIKGLKIRTSGGAQTKFVEACGGVPMTISTSELYESLEKGIVDGSVSSGSQTASWNLAEVEPYFVDMPLYVGVWLTIMNKDSYAKLPADLQKIIDQYSGIESSLVMAGYLQDENDDAYEAATASGSEWLTVADADLAQFKAAASAQLDSWIAEKTTDGFDAKAYQDDIQTFAAKYADK